MAAAVKELLILFGLSRVNSSILDFFTIIPQSLLSVQIKTSATGAAKHLVVIQQSSEKTQEAAALFRKMIRCK